MRIAIDLDGTICEIRVDTKTYEEVLPLPGAVERLKEFRQAGHYIIILTARHMKTCGSNPGLVMAKIAKVTLDWLEKHQIPYDEIFFGKPNADVYIDDRAMRFSHWEELSLTFLETTAKEK